MSIVKGNCLECGEEIDVQMCCNQFDCGCRGLPVDPPFCSEKCYDIYMKKSQSNGKF